MIWSSVSEKRNFCNGGYIEGPYNHCGCECVLQVHNNRKMFGKDIISEVDYTVESSHLVGDAVRLMENLEVSELAVVKDNIYLGLVSMDDIIDLDASLHLCDIANLELRRDSIDLGDHVLHIYQKFIASGLSLIPVLDGNLQLKGGISRGELFIHLGKLFNLTDPGSLIVLKLDRRDYSLGEIGRIVEQENTSILSSLISGVPDSQQIYVSLKLNSFDIQGVIQSFERFDYEVVAYFTEESYEDFLTDRYNEFINFLEI